eukprot:jgi/Tetstr1/442635/TSEL_030730.t1
MTCRGSRTAPKTVDVGKAAAIEGVGTTVTDHDPIEAARRKAEVIKLKQLTQEQLSRFFTTRMPPAIAGEEDAIPGGNESRAGGQDKNLNEPGTHARRGTRSAATIPWRHVISFVPPMIRPKPSNRRAPPSDPAAAYGAFRRVCRTSTKTPTFIADAAAKAPWSELMRGVIETLYGTDDWGAKVLDMLTTSFTASTYSNGYEGKFRLFAEFRIDEEDIFPPDYTEAIVSATSPASRSAAPFVPALCNPTLPSTSSYVTPVGMTPRPPA